MYNSNAHNRLEKVISSLSRDGEMKVYQPEAAMAVSDPQPKQAANNEVVINIQEFLQDRYGADSHSGYLIVCQLW